MELTFEKQYICPKRLIWLQSQQKKKKNQGRNSENKSQLVTQFTTNTYMHICIHTHHKMRPQLCHHIKNSENNKQLATQFAKQNQHEVNEEGHLLAYHGARKSGKKIRLLLNLLHKISIHQRILIYYTK